MSTVAAYISALLLTLVGFVLPAQSASANAVWVLPLQGPIGPATSDLLVRTLDRAESEGAHALVITLDTPGGLDLAMRDMIKVILHSTVPVVVYVSPNGARAASAGTYLTYAAHVAAMAPATNIGSSTPVSLGGGSPFPIPAKPPGPPIGPDNIPDPAATEPAAQSGDAMERKVINDAAAYIRGLAILRGRNADWAERSVREGVNLTAQDALQENVVDLLASSLPELLTAIDGRTLTVVDDQVVVLATKDATLVQIKPDWRYEFLAVITNPNVAYLLLMVGLYGLIIEFYNPGMGVPGVIGGICLLIGAFALQMLPINYVGLALIIFGIALMIAEAMAPSFGILGLGGIAAFAIGSIMLFDTQLPGFRISLALIGALAACSAAVFVFALGAAIRMRAKPVVTGKAALIGAKAKALEDFNGNGRVHVMGEDWQAVAAVDIEAGDDLRITAVDGLTLTVEPQG